MNAQQVKVDMLTRRAQKLVGEAAEVRESLPPRRQLRARLRALRTYQQLIAEAKALVDEAERQ